MSFINQVDSDLADLSEKSVQMTKNADIVAKVKLYQGQSREKQQNYDTEFKNIQPALRSVGLNQSNAAELIDAIAERIV